MAIRLGDTLVFGLRLVHGDEVRDFTLRLTAVLPAGETSSVTSLEVTPEDLAPRTYESRNAMAVLDLCSPGAEPATSTLWLPADFLCHGLHGVCAQAGRYREIRRLRECEGRPLEDVCSPAEIDASFRSMVTLLSVIQLIQKDEHLAALLHELVSLGDMLTVALAGGLTTQASFDLAVPSPMLDPLVGEAWSLPMAIAAGATRLIDVRLLIAAPRAPFALAGGLLALQAHRVGDPSRQLSLVLIGARRGVEPLVLDRS
ncbi:MAG: hypothetical protein KDC98_03565 [Planctomycetes bacterium]|nr:hypothetical protein [Planctomycetota bacterium]